MNEEQKIRQAGERARKALRELTKIWLDATYRTDRYFGPADPRGWRTAATEDTEKNLEKTQKRT